MMFLVLPPALYTSLTGETVVEPHDPGPVPAYDPNNNNPPANHIIMLNWQIQKERFLNMQNANKALIQVTKRSLDRNYQTALTTIMVGTNDKVYLPFFDNLWRKFGRGTPEEHYANQDKMNNPWDPVTQDLVFLLKQIRDASIYGFFTNRPIPEHDLITAGERAIINSGVFAQQYTEWLARSVDQRIWNDFETFWTDKYDIWMETSRTTAQAGFGGNATGEVANGRNFQHHGGVQQRTAQQYRPYPPSSPNRS
jgi:hypothetical protein